MPAITTLSRILDNPCISQGAPQPWGETEPRERKGNGVVGWGRRERERKRTEYIDLLNMIFMMGMAHAITEASKSHDLLPTHWRTDAVTQSESKSLRTREPVV